MLAFAATLGMTCIRTAVANLIPIDLTRGLAVNSSAYGGVTSVNDSRQDSVNDGADFSPFSLSLPSSSADGTAVGEATSFLSYTIGSAVVSASGNGESSAMVSNPSIDEATGFSDSLFLLHFTVDVATSFRLSGSITATGVVGPAAYGETIQLSDSTGNIADLFETYNVQSFDITGTFLPGETYSLFADVGGVAHAGTSYPGPDVFQTAVTSLFQFELSTEPSEQSVPDTGSSLALLSLALICLGSLKRS